MIRLFFRSLSLLHGLDRLRLLCFAAMPSRPLLYLKALAVCSGRLQPCALPPNQRASPPPPFALSRPSGRAAESPLLTTVFKRSWGAPHVFRGPLPLSPPLLSPFSFYFFLSVLTWSTLRTAHMVTAPVTWAIAPRRQGHCALQPSSGATLVSMRARVTHPEVRESIGQVDDLCSMWQTRLQGQVLNLPNSICDIAARYGGRFRLVGI